MSLLGSPFFFSSGAAGGDFYSYEINQSLRFEAGDNPYMAQTFTDSGGTIFTFSCWVKITDSTTSRCLLQGYADSNNFSQIVLYGGSASTDGYVGMYSATGGTARLFAYTQALQRDPNAWYHIVIKFNGTSGAEEFKIYINGENQDLTVSTALTAHQSLIGNSNAHYFGNNFNLSLDMDGYIAETNFIDGTALDADSFGETKAGIWIPKQYSGSYGTNGFYLNFSDSSSLGTDSSGRGNNMTSVSGVHATDQVPDSPTNNFCTYNFLDRNAFNNSFMNQGNLNVADYVATAALAVGGTISMRSGKWYFEVLRKAAVNGGYWGIIREDKFVGQNSLGNTGLSAGDFGYYVDFSGALNKNGSATASFLSSFAQDDILNVAYDADTGKVWFGKNNSWGGSGDPASGTNEAGTVDSPDEYGYKVWTRVIGNAFSYEQATLNCGQDSTFANEITAGGNADANGIGDFKYEPPSGFLALCTANLANPGIDPAKNEEPADYFNTVLYAGNGSTGHAITGVGFQPDWVWIKGQNYNGSSHALNDSVRGVTKRLSTDLDSSESTNAEFLQSFDSDGFTVGNHAAYNNGSYNYVSWNWKVNGGSTSNVSAGASSNIRLIGGGTADQAAVQANTEAGISIVSFENTARGSSDFLTFPHGLNSAPEMVWVKSRDSSNYWAIYHASEGLKLGFLGSSLGTNAFITSTFWNEVNDTTVKFQSNGNLTTTDEDIIAYCFHSVDGYSKMGSYTGNGSSDGPFVYTGFRPAWVMIKKSSGTDGWSIYDNKREPFNVMDSRLLANSNADEASSSNIRIDFLSNGFKLRGTGSTINTSGQTYITFVFAEQPFKYSNAR